MLNWIKRSVQDKNRKPYIVTQLLRNSFLNIELIDYGSILKVAIIENRSGSVGDQFSILKKELK